MKPLISIITPSYNSEKYIEQTILSIQNQSYKNFEHIIIDGKSTDNTLEIIKKYKDKVKFISEKDAGMYDAINKGLKLAKGEIVAYLNSDDLYHPNTLTRVAYNYLKTENDVFIGFTDYANEKGEIVYTYKYPFIIQNICLKLGRMPFSQPATFWSKKWMEKVGLFDKNFRFTGDLEFFLRLLNTNKISYFFTSFAIFRYHKTQLSNQFYKMERECYKAFLKHRGFYRSMIPPLRLLLFRIFYEVTFKIMNLKPIIINLLNLIAKNKYYY